MTRAEILAEVQAIAEAADFVHTHWRGPEETLDKVRVRLRAFVTKLEAEPDNTHKKPLIGD